MGFGRHLQGAHRTRGRQFALPRNGDTKKRGARSFFETASPRGCRRCPRRCGPLARGRGKASRCLVRGRRPCRWGADGGAEGEPVKGRRGAPPSLRRGRRFGTSPKSDPSFNCIRRLARRRVRTASRSERRRARGRRDAEAQRRFGRHPWGGRRSFGRRLSRGASRLSVDTLSEASSGFGERARGLRAERRRRRGVAADATRGAEADSRDRQRASASATRVRRPPQSASG
jgi:hypothetical protein